jgi:hypothetical protein
MRFYYYLKSPPATEHTYEYSCTSGEYWHGLPGIGLIKLA